jgi:hypothetical protein
MGQLGRHGTAWIRPEQGREGQSRAQGPEPAPISRDVREIMGGTGIHGPMSGNLRITCGDLAGNRGFPG